MTNDMEEIERFAKSTLGAIPEIIKLLADILFSLKLRRF